MMGYPSISIITKLFKTVAVKAITPIITQTVYFNRISLIERVTTNGRIPMLIRKRYARQLRVIIWTVRPKLSANSIGS